MKETIRTGSLKDNRDGTATIMVTVHYDDHSREDIRETGEYFEMARRLKKLLPRATAV